MSIIGVIILIFATPFVFASNDNANVNVSLLSDNDAQVVIAPYGAQLRLLQLEKRIDIQIDSANNIISKIESENSTFNTTQLKEIVLELEALKNEIPSSDLNESSDILAQNYVALKAKAINLSQEFKDIAQDAFGDKKLEQVREEIKAQVKMKQNEKNETIEDLKAKYNGEKLENFLGKLDIISNKTIDQVKSGEINLGEVRSQIMLSMQNMTKEQQKEFLDKLKETRIKYEIEAKEQKQNIIQNATVKMNEIESRIKTKIESDDFKNIIENKMNSLDDSQKENEVENEDSNSQTTENSKKES